MITVGDHDALFIWRINQPGQGQVTQEQLQQLGARLPTSLPPPGGSTAADIIAKTVAGPTATATAAADASMRSWLTSDQAAGSRSSGVATGASGSNNPVGEVQPASTSPTRLASAVLVTGPTGLGKAAGTAALALGTPGAPAASSGGSHVDPPTSSTVVGFTPSLGPNVLWHAETGEGGRQG